MFQQVYRRGGRLVAANVSRNRLLKETLRGGTTTSLNSLNNAKQPFVRVQQASKRWLSSSGHRRLRFSSSSSSTFSELLSTTQHSSIRSFAATPISPRSRTPRHRSRRTGSNSNHSPLLQWQQQQQHQQQQQQEEIVTSQDSGYLIPVTARHIAQTIDLFPVLSTVFIARNASRKHKMFGKTSFVVELPQLSLDSPYSRKKKNRYVAVFRFGSIVALNVSPRELADIIQQIKSHHMTEPALSGFERKENFGVLIQPPSGEDGSTESSVVTGDCCVVPELDMNGVAVISHIMAQTVALDSYNDTVDGLLANFAEINATVVKTGEFTPSHKDFLMRTVAQNNSIFIDMISRVRIKDRSETAWNLIKYEDIHYGMKEEFEIDDRFDQIEFKLNLIQQNAKFFLEMLQDKKSNSLEWTIVILIVMECVLMCVEMSGMGEPLFQSLTKFFQ